MFFKETSDIYLGQTTISNVFIDIFMPMANGLYVKVYLLGYKHACEPFNGIKFNNSSIAKNLEIPLSDVDESWRFWEKKNIVKIHKDFQEDFNYTVEFLDLDKFYIENIYDTVYKNSETIEIEVQKNDMEDIISYDQYIETEYTEDIYDENDNEDKMNMFKDIENIIGFFLSQGDKIKILNIMENYNINCDVVIYAYQSAKNSNTSMPPFNYIENTLLNWHSDNLFSIEDIKDYQANRSAQFKKYKEIFKHIGFPNAPSKEEQKLMDNWLELYDIEVILYACEKLVSIPKSQMQYLDAMIKSWYKEGLTTLDEIKNYDINYKQNKKKNNNNVSNKNSGSIPKTRYHNIETTYDKYSDDELEKILLEGQKNRFK